MAIRVNPKLIDELELYGAEDVQNCYHCGNCSAVCSHANDTYVFPRKFVRYLQMGLERKLETSIEPWLCYYCGQCSEQCPRHAEPGETMMSLRRWLTSRYDLTGISRIFYKSWKAEFVAILLLALLTAVGFFTYGFLTGDIHIYDGTGAFLPSSAVHVFDWSMAGILSFLLALNAVHMWWLIIAQDKSVPTPIWLYIKNIILIPLHFFSQKRYGECENRKKLWVIHMGLMISYITMLILIMFFLRDMQAGPAIRWSVHTFGYLASIGLITTIIFMIYGRFKQTEPQFQHSHESDWIFLILLLYVTFTGVLQHILHRSEFGSAANIAYIVHMMGVVPMLVLEVPFSKWSHMIYRPLAMYFAAIREDALAMPVRAKRESAGELLAR